MRLALGIEYNGALYHGWQRQQTVASVQQHVEEALAKIANEPVNVTCAGRTDAGVHATCQVVHFDTLSQRPDRAWTIGLNRFLPKSIAIKWVKNISDEFHARFSATARRYRYIIYNHRLRNGILPKGVTHIHSGDLDHELMHDAAQYLVGRHDFSAFRAVNCQANTPVRNMTSISVTRFGDYIMIDVTANAFLHHMVRNITGSLLKVGSKEKPITWIQTLLQDKDRTKAAATAKPNGLYLVHVTYPEEFDLPKTPLGPLFLPD
ncbi:tRNA pseudouridine(38-40) synthase TruA [Paraglaciecola arctica]|uniref:tRNA pseudouridine(38-40) synthase TruA n=1 Tax=Paraglaciecola arctica TaxID=1128911 RepID=UPI001C06FBF5|nr:tRNA pseudouridine(38-40) synthase TruA [Paraglaciecola arctica]MBU3003008.1 tRNA pseudouridine(38-40) synthase TruA [Paraglaciecola arctica]